MPNIIIRPSGYSSKKHSAPTFHPHFNRSLGDDKHPTGKYFHTKESYYSELKSRGLEPYDPSAKDCGKRTPYKPSQALKETITAIKDQTKKGKFKPSDRLIKKMQSMGVKTHISQKELQKLPKGYKEGGFA